MSSLALRPDAWPEHWPDPDPDRLLRIPMSYDEWLALPEGIRAEYVRGVAIVTPPPTQGHNKIERRIANLIEDATVGLSVSTGPGLTSHVRDHRIPDVAAFTGFEDVSITTMVPVIAVEILSASTRSEDMIHKSAEYAADGIGQYWIVDRDARTLLVLANNGHGWDRVDEFSDDHPTGTIALGDYGEVPIDLPTLLELP